jgi:hypothetical protein
MRAILQSWFGVVRGGVHPREIAVAVFLGTVAGFTLGWNLTFACVLLLVLLLRAPIKIVIEAAALGCALSWAFTPTVFYAGRYVLHQTAFGEWLAPRSDNLWIVLADLDRYVIAGGLFIGIALGLTLGFAVAKLTAWMQHRFASLKEKVQAHETWKNKLWVRIVCWLIFGSPERAKQTAAPTRWVRVSGVVVACVVLVPLAAAGWYFIPRLSERAILYGMSMANGAEVNADQVKLSLSDGMLYMKNVQIADPDDLYKDRLRIAHLNAVVNPGLLLRGHVEIEQVLLEGFSADVPREHRAEPYRPELPGFDKGAGRLKLPKAEALKDVSLKDVLKKGEDVNHRLELAQQIITKLEELTGDDERERQKGPRPYYLALREARCDFGNPRPGFAVRLLRAEDPAPQWGLGRSMSIQVANLSSDPKRLGEPTRVEIVDPEASLEIEAEFDLHRKNGKHSLSLEMRDQEITSLVGEHALGDALALQGGKFNVSGRGSVNSREIDLSLALAVQDVRLAADKNETVAGLPADVWCKGLAHLKNLEVSGRLYGPIQSPHVEIDVEKLAHEVKSHLGEIGEEVLASAAEKHLRGDKQQGRDAIAEAKRAADELTGSIKGRDGDESWRTAGKVDDILPGIASQIKEELEKAEQPPVEPTRTAPPQPKTEAPAAETQHAPRREERKRRDRYTQQEDPSLSTEPDPPAAHDDGSAAAQVPSGWDTPYRESAGDRYAEGDSSPLTSPQREAVANPLTDAGSPPVANPIADPAADRVIAPAPGAVWQPMPPPRYGSAAPARRVPDENASPPPTASAEPERRGPGETASLPPIGQFPMPPARTEAPPANTVARPTTNAPPAAAAQVPAPSADRYVNRTQPATQPAAPAVGAAAASDRSAEGAAAIGAYTQVRPADNRYYPERTQPERTLGQRYADRYKQSGTATAASTTSDSTRPSGWDAPRGTHPPVAGPRSSGPASANIQSAIPPAADAGQRAVAANVSPRVGQQVSSPTTTPSMPPAPRNESLVPSRPIGAKAMESQSYAQRMPPGGPQVGSSYANQTGTVAATNDLSNVPPGGRMFVTPNTTPADDRHASAPSAGAQPAGVAPPSGVYTRQPSVTPAPPQEDEWRITRWARGAGSRVRGLFSSEEDAEMAPPETQPAVPPTSRPAAPPATSARNAGAAVAHPPANDVPAMSAPEENQSFLQRIGLFD